MNIIKTIKNLFKISQCVDLGLSSIEYDLLSVISKHKNIPIKELSKAYKQICYVDPLLIVIDKSRHENMNINDYINKYLNDDYIQETWH